LTARTIELPVCALRAHLHRGEPSMPVDPRPAMPIVPPRQAAFRARRNWLVTQLATCVTVLAAAAAVLIVAAAAVAFTIT
jgi:hypothetical protein